MVKSSYMGAWKQAMSDLRFADLQLIASPPERFLRDICAARSGNHNAVIRVKRFLLEKRAEACHPSFEAIRRLLNVTVAGKQAEDAGQATGAFWKKFSNPAQILRSRPNTAKPGEAYLSFVMDLLRTWGRAQLLVKRQPPSPVWDAIGFHLNKIGEAFSTHLVSYYRIELLMPERGDIFDPAKHFAVNVAGKEGPLAVERTEQIGFKRMEKMDILEKAMVIVRQR